MRTLRSSDLTALADQITSNAAGPGSITIGLAISRERWGFTERDRVILDLLHPYLGLGPARAAHAAHMRQCHRALAGDPAHHDAALIVLTRRGRIAWLTPPAARVVRGDRALTATLLIAGSGDAEPLLVLEQTITPNPARMAALGLSSREAEILLAAAHGLTETAIGERLAVSPRTVNKHLEHIYRRLEVTGRRQAVAVAFS